jgi:hypothetical protein
VRAGNAPLQLIDQLVDDLPFLLFHLHQAPQAIRDIEVAAGFGQGPGPPTQADLVVDPSANLGQQKLKSLRLAVIGVNDGPVHVCLSQLGCGA